MKTNQIIFLVGLLINSLALTSPLNSCPSFQVHWTTLLTTSVGNNFSTPITASITLSTAQPNNNIQAAVGYRRITLPQIYHSILIELYVSSVSSTTIVVAITAPRSGAYLQQLKAVVLMVPQIYNSYVFVLKPTGCLSSCNFDFTLNSGSIASLIQTYSTSLPAGTYQYFGFINHIGIQYTNGVNNVLGISLSLSILNATHYYVKFTNVSPDPIILHSYRTTVIAYRDPPSIFGAAVTVLFMSTLIISDNSISLSKTFFGICYYIFDNADFQFDISISGNSASLSGSANLLSLGVMLISFEVGKCCGGTSYMDNANTTCIDICPPRSYQAFYTAIITKGCQKCSYDCYTCTNSVSCTSCNGTTDFRQLNTLTLRCEPMVGYYETGVSVALPCIYPKCCGYTPVKFVQNTTCLFTCPIGFAQNSTTRQCFLCNPGYWPISGHCSNVVGCVSTIVQNGNVQCIFCRLSDHFILHNQICVCTEGYNLDKISGRCVEVCGDGIHFSQKCDDNNTENGDGCSSTCQPEDYFKCESSSNYIHSQCAFIGPVSLSFKYANKSEGKNQAVFSFSFSTKRVKLNAANIVSSFVFTCDPRIKLITMSASSTEVLLFVEYEQDLQGKLGNATFILNPKKVLSNTSLSISFPMIAQSKLVVVHVYPIIINLKKAIQIIALTALLVFVLASFSRRIIAVELLESILLVYFVCIQNSNQTESFTVFKNLKILALNFDTAANYYSRVSIYQYSFQNQQTTKKIITLFLLASIFAISLQKIIRQCLIDTKDKFAAINFKILKIIRYIFKSLLFSLSVGYGYQVLFPNFFIHSFSYQNTCIVIFLTINFALLFFREVNLCFLKKNDCLTSILLKNRSYTAQNLIFWLTTMIILSTNNIRTNVYLQQMLLTVVLLFFLWLIYIRPYNSGLQNIGQILNLATDVVFLSWSTGRKYSQYLTDQYTEMYFSIIIVSLMFASILLAIFRLIHFIHQSYQYLTDNHVTATQKLKVQLKDTVIASGRRQLKETYETNSKYIEKSIALGQQLLRIHTSINPNIYLLQKKNKLSRPRQKYSTKENEVEQHIFGNDQRHAHK